MTAPYDNEALWMKARLFINHAMDDEPRTFDEQALWAALSLELLAKAALSKRSPLLIASPTEEGDNLLIASGLMEGDARFKSIPAHTLYSRCAKAFKPFSEKDAKAITGARNEYLHGASARFSPIPSDAWWPRFWSQAVILINALDKSLELFVGYERRALVEKHLEKNRQNVTDRVEMLISRASQRLAMKRSGQMTEAAAKEFSSQVALVAGYAHAESETCPACQSVGTLEGEDIISMDELPDEPLYHEGDDMIQVEIVAEHFSCSTCRLVLDGNTYVTQAGLPDTFIGLEETPRDWGDDEYGND